MRAIITTAYGPESVLQLRELPTPTPGDREVLVEVHATTVTAADHRLRAADFPSFTALIGRLMIGMRGPKRAVQGTNFAGRVVAVGPGVTRYAIGDEVFGATDHGAYAEYLTVREDGPMARKPERLSYAEAAALPYGAVTALAFLRDLAKVRAGDKVLVLGASGGVGRYAVEIAKHLGAEVTAVCSAATFRLVRGADHLIDSRAPLTERYDVIFDVAGVGRFSRAQLSPSGVYLTLLISVRVLLQMLWTSFGGGARAKFAVVFGDAKMMAEIAELADRGVLRPVIARSFALEQLAEAHAARDRGTVVVEVRAQGWTPRPKSTPLTGALTVMASADAPDVLGAATVPRAYPM